MTVQDDFYNDNMNQSSLSKKKDMHISISLLLGLSEVPNLSIEQIFQQLLPSPGDMDTFLRMLLMDDWKYVSTFAAMDTVLASVIPFREQLRGLSPAKTIPFVALNLGDATVLSIYTLWKGVPSSAHLASVVSSLILISNRNRTPEADDLCQQLEEWNITIADLYEITLITWPEKRFPTVTFNTLYAGDQDDVQTDIKNTITLFLAVQAGYENQATAPNFCD